MGPEGPRSQAPDGLEVTAIGTLYKGAWDKKYWSSSRGKDRYPYPVGYQAVRNHVGHIYKMEIREGTKGPAFVVISEEGISCMGDTPTIAWEQIQKKKNMRVQKWYRTQFSKVDGAELFGFTNPLVQRLFRELMANENGTAEQSDRTLNRNRGNLKSDIGICNLSGPILEQSQLSMSNASDASLEQQQKTGKDNGKGMGSTAELIWGARRKRNRLAGRSECSAEQNVTCDACAKVDPSLRGKKICSSCPEESKGNPVSKEKTDGLISGNNLTDSGNQRAANSIQSHNVLTYSRRHNVCRSGKQRSKQSFVDCLDGRMDANESMSLPYFDIKMLSNQSNPNQENEMHRALELLSDGCIAEEAKISDMMNADLENLKQHYNTPASAPVNIVFSENRSECIASGESRASILTSTDFSKATQNLQPPAIMKEGSTRKKRLKLDKRKSVLSEYLKSPKGNVEENIPDMAAENRDARKQPTSSFGAEEETGLFVPDTLDLVEDDKYLNSFYMAKDVNHASCGISVDKDEDVCALLGNSVTIVSDLSGHLREVERSQGPEHSGILQACIDSGANNNNVLPPANLGKATVVTSELDSNSIQPYTAIGYNQLHTDCTLDSSIRNAKQTLQEIKAERVLKDDKAAVVPLESDPVFSVKDETLANDSDWTPSQQTRQFTATQSSDGKGDSDSMGQELAKSMMTLLLPQALPLLKQTGKKKRKNKSEEDKHMPSLAECNLKLEPFNKIGIVRNETEKSHSSGMCLATDLDNRVVEITAMNVGPSVGRTVADCRLCSEIPILHGKSFTIFPSQSPEVKTAENSFLSGTAKKTKASDTVSSYTKTKLKDFRSGMTQTANVVGIFPSAKQIPNEEMVPFSMQTINGLEICKQDDASQGDVNNKQKLCNATYVKTTDETDEIHGDELLIVPFNGKQKHEGTAQSNAFGLSDVTGNSIQRGFLKSEQIVYEAFEFKNNDSLEGKGVNFDSSKEDKENINVSIVKQDPAVAECVVPDSFEDEQCSDDNVKRRSCHLGPTGKYKIPVNGQRDSCEGHSPLVAVAESDLEAPNTSPMNLKENELNQKTEGFTHNMVTTVNIVNSVMTIPSNPEVLSICLLEQGNESNTLECTKLESAFSQQSSEKTNALHECKHNFSTDETCETASFCSQTTNTVLQVAYCNSSGMQKMGLARLTGTPLSGTYDIEENITMVNFLDHISLNKGDHDDNSFSKFDKMSSGKNEKCKSISSFDPGAMVPLLDQRHDKQIQFEDSKHASTLSQREKIAKCELLRDNLNVSSYEAFFQYGKCHSVDSAKVGWYSDQVCPWLQNMNYPANDLNLCSEPVGATSVAGIGDLPDQFYAGDEEPDSKKLSSTGNLQKEGNAACSTEKQLVKSLPRHLEEVSAEVSIHTSASCCQPNSERGVHGRAAEGNISPLEKESDVEEPHTSSPVQPCSKEVSHKRSTSWAEDKFAMPQHLFEEKADCAFLQQTLNVCECHSQVMRLQNAGKLSEIRQMGFLSVSNLELASYMAKHMSNIQTIGDLPDTITEKENLFNLDKEVGVASCIQSMLEENLNKHSEGIPAVLTFSDVPPCTFKSNLVIDCEDIEHGPLFREECLHPGLASGDVNMLGVHELANGNKNVVETSELVGWYEHPIPVLSLVLRVWGKDVHLCVVCGLPWEKERNLFIYKAVTGEASGEYSSLIGHTVVVLPDGGDYSDAKCAFDRSGIQLTPDGQNLILLESIRIQDMGKQAVNCVRSECISHGQCLGHGVKLVSVKNEFVSVLTRLTSMESMYCILVSVPQSLIAAGENGCVHVWKMDLRWSMCVEEFVLPSATCTSSSILELVAVPHMPHLIIGRNCDAYYAIWDISKRLLLSTFCSVDWFVFQTLVLDVVNWDRHDDMGMRFKGMDCKLPSKIDNIKGCKDNTLSRYLGELMMSRNNLVTPHLEFNETNMAVCLLVLAAPHTDQIQENKYEVCDERNLTGSWRLAVLKNNVLLMGNILDVRASVAAVLSQNGVIGTSEGHIYTWEVMTGRKLFTLKDFEGVSISCISADPLSTAFAVAGDDHRVLLYMNASRC